MRIKKNEDKKHEDKKHEHKKHIKKHEGKADQTQEGRRTWKGEEVLKRKRMFVDTFLVFRNLGK